MKHLFTDKKARFSHQVALSFVFLSHTGHVLVTSFPRREEICCTAQQEVKDPIRLTLEALPKMPHLLQEAFQSGRQLSKLPRASELDIRQVYSLVLSESE